MPAFRIVSRESHPKGLLYQIAVADRTIGVILTRHASHRLLLWQCTEEQAFDTLLFPEEVLTGHRNRFIAHRRYGEHILRLVYEYEGGIPLIVTVYFPYSRRYFRGGGSYADQILP